MFKVERLFFSRTVMEIPWPGRILVELSKRLRAKPWTDFTVFEPLRAYAVDRNPIVG